MCGSGSGRGCGGVHTRSPFRPPGCPALGASGKRKCVALPSSIPNTRFVTVGLLTDAGLLALFFFFLFFSLVKRKALRNLLGKDLDNGGEEH